MQARMYCLKVRLIGLVSCIHLMGAFHYTSQTMWTNKMSTNLELVVEKHNISEKHNIYGPRSQRAPSSHMIPSSMKKGRFTFIQSTRRAGDLGIGCFFYRRPTTLKPHYNKVASCKKISLLYPKMP